MLVCVICQLLRTYALRALPLSMKFAQYLRDTQIPEWKKAYIDYRGIKKRITAIRNVQQGTTFNESSDEDTPDETPSPPDAPRASDAESDEFERLDGLPVNRTASPDKGVPDDAQSEPKKSRTSGHGRGSFRIPSFKQGKSFASTMGSNDTSPPRQTLQANPLAALPLHELFEHLSPQEVSFFTMLDVQLDKVESFYLAREKEMLARGHTLKIQLDELHDHRRLFHRARPRETWRETVFSSVRNLIGLYPPLKVPSKWDIQQKSTPPTAADTKRTICVTTGTTNVSPADITSQSTKAETSAQTSALQFLPSTKSLGKRKDVEETTAQSSDDNDSPDEHVNIHNLPLSADPDSYLYAKRKLKKAVIEHYRGLEMLHNYRILNVTGFRKALKKFEKVTKIPAQNQYMTEKVEKSAFASDSAIRQMMTRMEDMYAASFAHGNKKKAMKRLRIGSKTKNHHFSTFRSGLALGLALPALIDGIVKVFQPHTREALPQWSVLLYVYGIILVPLLFSLLVGFNLLVWANARINYVFIFELEVLSHIDHRAYFETPALLLAALCYAFWFSFSLIGPPAMSPNMWPLVWLAFTGVVVLNPFPIMFRSSRYWLVLHVAELFTSGTKHVEFTDFWMGDQFCSLVFTLSNLYFLVCVYVDGFSPDWEKCNVSSKKWPIAFLLASLPQFIRLVQSIKRYADSKLVTHLINGGKYGSGIVAFLFYFMWRHHQINHGSIFALYILTSITYSAYSLAWDLLMDWSVLRAHSPHPLLRPDLVYSNNIPMYYFAIVTNFLIRFAWVIYIPKGGPSMMLRSFIVGMLEMLRRIQWNFYRLENEHLGNVDQYRVTREVPLPYAVDESRDYDKEDDEDDHDLKLKR